MTDTQHTTHVHIADLILVRPGDRVLIAFKDHLSQDDADEIKHRLNERFPGTEWTLAGGIKAVVQQAASSD